MLHPSPVEMLAWPTPKFEAPPRLTNEGLYGKCTELPLVQRRSQLERVVCFVWMVRPQVRGKSVDRGAEAARHRSALRLFGQEIV